MPVGEGVLTPVLEDEPKLPVELVLLEVSFVGSVAAVVFKLPLVFSFVVLRLLLVLP